MVMTNKMKFNKKYGFKLNEPHSLADLAKISGVKKSILQSVFDRGTGAWKNNKESVRNVKGVKGGTGPKMSKEQWSYARVYSFLVGGKTQTTADRDLAIKAGLIKEKSKSK